MWVNQPSQQNWELGDANQRYWGLAHEGGEILLGPGDPLVGRQREWNYTGTSVIAGFSTPGQGGHTMLKALARDRRPANQFLGFSVRKTCEGFDATYRSGYNTETFIWPPGTPEAHAREMPPAWQAAIAGALEGLPRAAAPCVIL